MENKNRNEEQTKKLLNNILQKLLERRLNKLEKKNKEEESILKIINKESQKAILDLEECSHKVRKQIYLLKNKYVDERRRSENPLKNEKINNNREISKGRNNNVNNINTNLFNTYGNDLNVKKSEISLHEKEEKLRGKKKRNITQSPKANKNLLYEEKMKSLQKSIKDVKEKFKSTKNIKKPHKNFYIVETTPKKTKPKTLHSNSKKKLSKKNSGKFSKTLINFRTNITSTNQIEKKKSENETKKNKLDELSTNAIGKSDEDLRLPELKLKNDKEINKNNENIKSKKSLVSQNNEEIKSPNLDQFSIKDESLLVKNLGSLNNAENSNSNNNLNNNIESKENNINSISNINIDIANISNINLSKDNIILDDNNKKEIINEKKSDEINTNIDNIDNRYSKNNINNIILSNNNKNNIDYLKGDASINFTLIEPEVKNEENDRTMDLNISGLSDQLTLEEKFQTHLDYVLRYVDNRDICTLLLVNKECFKTIMNFLISKTEIKIDILEEEIPKIIEENKNSLSIDINNIKIKKFEFNANSSRAISLLNTISIQNFLKIKNDFLNNKEIAIIFDILFIADGKNEIIRIDNLDKKWEYILNFFKEYIMKQSLGTFIENKFNGKIFENNVINSLYRYSCKYLNIISPNHFQKINKDIAIMVFIIKDMMEHLGILTNTNLNPEKELILMNSKLQSNKEILKKLNEMNNKII